MRRVDSEGESRGVRGRKQGGAQSKSKLRRASLESLERRELLSTLDVNAPLACGALAASLANGPSADTALTADPERPQSRVSTIDPANPQKLVAVLGS